MSSRVSGYHCEKGIPRASLRKLEITKRQQLRIGGLSPRIGPNIALGWEWKRGMTGVIRLR